MLEASCHCGAVRLRIPGPLAEVTACNCSICRRTAALWAYFPPARVEITADPPTDTYVWGDRTLAFHRCHVCGCLTHWAPLVPVDRMGINARLLPPKVLAAASVHHFDGAAG
jgi:hypothetical protein